MRSFSSTYLDGVTLGCARSAAASRGLKSCRLGWYLSGSVTAHKWRSPPAEIVTPTSMASAREISKSRSRSCRPPLLSDIQQAFISVSKPAHCQRCHLVGLRVRSGPGPLLLADFLDPISPQAVKMCEGLKVRAFSARKPSRHQTLNEEKAVGSAREQASLQTLQLACLPPCFARRLTLAPP